MSHYRRNYIEGGTFFFTVKLADPKSRLLVEHINLLRETYASVQKRYLFETVAICVMPNHLHAVWTLPDGDSDYSLRWRLIKTGFSNHFSASDGLSASKRSLYTHSPRAWLRHTPYRRFNACRFQV